MNDLSHEDLIARLTRLRRSIIFMEAASDDAGETILQLRQELLDLRENLQRSTDRVAVLEQTVRDIESSNVWKATRPLVSLLDKAKGRRPAQPPTQDVLPQMPLSLAESYEILRTDLWPTSEKRVLQALASSSSKPDETVVTWLAYQPQISVCLFVDGVNRAENALESLLAQSYPHWRLHILYSEAEAKGEAEKLGQKDPRISIEQFGNESSVARILAVTGSDYYATLTADTILWPNALFEIVSFINAHPTMQFLYADEENHVAEGCVNPILKPGWSPEYLRSFNYIGDFVVFGSELADSLRKTAGLPDKCSPYDISLSAARYYERISKEKPFCEIEAETARVPRILFSVTGDPARRTSLKSLEHDVKEREIAAEIVETLPGVFHYKYRLANLPLVSIIIPTKDKPEYIERCIGSIRSASTYKNLEILITDTGSIEEDVFELYKRWQSEDPRIKVIQWEDKFNFAAVCNFAAESAKGEFLVFLNNDTEVLSPDWIEAMLEQAQFERVGSVGAKLVYPDGMLQHVGVALGIGGVAGHYLRSSPDVEGASFPTYYTKDAVREVAACTGACLMMRTSVFKRVGGFDPAFRIAFNDVDLALRLLFREGLWNVYTPHAMLRHFESVSVGVPGVGDRSQHEFWRETQRMMARWEDRIARDPFYHPLLSLKSDIPALKLSVRL